MSRFFSFERLFFEGCFCVHFLYFSIMSAFFQPRGAKKRKKTEGLSFGNDVRHRSDSSSALRECREKRAAGLIFEQKMLHYKAK